MSEEPDNRPEILRRLYPRKSPRGPVLMPKDPAAATAYARAAFSGELETLSRTPEGERNAQLNVAAFSLGQLVGGGYLELEPTSHALRTVALGIGLTATETDATLRSGLEAGQRQPRLVAELDADDDPPPVTVLRPEAAADEPTIMDHLPKIDWHDLWAQEDEEEWILKPLIPARRLVALFSAPKLGKSLLMLEIAVAVSRGMKILGVQTKQTRVLYVDFENDPRGDIKQRLLAMGMTPYQLEDLCYLSFPRLAHLDTVMGGLELMAAVEAYQCGLVVIDTVSRAVGGEENNNDTWLGFYRNTGVRLKAAEVACVRLDHTGKDEAKGMRGGSAKYGDVDAVWSMTKVSEEMFKLECTANRLVITEKELLIRREEDPLRHELDTRSSGQAHYDELDRICWVLDKINAPMDVSCRRGVELMREAAEGGSENNIHKAVTRRKNGENHPYVQGVLFTPKDAI